MSSARLKMLVALTVCFAAIAWFRHDLAAALRTVPQRLTFGAAAGILLVTVVHFVDEPLRWWVLLRQRHPTVSATRTYHALTATALASYVFPARLGMPARVFMATRVLGLDYATAASLLLVDAVFNYGIWSLVAVIGAVVLLPGSGVLIPAAALAVIATGGVTLLVLARRRWLAGRRGALTEALQLLSGTAILLNSSLLAIDILSYGVRHVLILAALGTQASLPVVTLAVAMSIVAGFVSLMPLGLGAYDLSLVFLLALIGVPREVAVAVPVLNRIATVSVGVVLGAVSALRLGITSRRQMGLAVDSEAMAESARLPGAEFEKP